MFYEKVIWNIALLQAFRTFHLQRHIFFLRYNVAMDVNLQGTRLTGVVDNGIVLDYKVVFLRFANGDMAIFLIQVCTFGTYD